MKAVIILLAMTIVAVQGQYGCGMTMGPSSVAPQTTGQMAGRVTTTGYGTTGMMATIMMSTSRASVAPVTATNAPATMMTTGYAATTAGRSSAAPQTTSRPVGTTAY